MAEAAKKSDDKKSDDKPTILILYYSLYGHVRTLAEEEAKGVEASGANVKIFQIEETLSDEVVGKMYGTKQKDFADKHPILTRDKLYELKNADGILFGIPTRFGMMPAQVKTLFDQTGSYWQTGAFIGKPVGVFQSTGTQGGGQETTTLTAVTQFAHHGMVFVPIGYGSPKLFDHTEIHGGSPYGAGTFAGAKGDRKVSDLEKEVAQYQGKYFAGFVSKLVKGSK
eukprot:83799_1